MSNLIRKEVEVDIKGEEFIMYFDMYSITVYKEITGRKFLSALDKLFNQDEEEMIYFIASTLRRKGDNPKPLGKEVLDPKFNILAILFKQRWTVIDIIASGLPDREDESQPKKK